MKGFDEWEIEEMQSEWLLLSDAPCALVLFEHESRYMISSYCIETDLLTVA